MKVRSCLRVTMLFVFLFFASPFLVNQPLHAQQVFGPFTCNAFACYDSSVQKYKYTPNHCTVTCNNLGFCTKQITQGLPIFSTGHLNTNYGLGTHALCLQNPPTGCEQGFYGPNTPTCSGQGGGGTGGEDECDYDEGCSANDPVCQANGAGQACPLNYVGDDCSGIPCGYRDECGCSACLTNCSAQCDQQHQECNEGGGNGPTPTPAPSCDLTCPGTSIDALGGGFSGPNSGMGAGVKGASTLLAQGATGGTWSSGSFHSCGAIDSMQGGVGSVTYGFGSIQGDLVYNGYDGFVCNGLFACPLDPNNPEACPEPTITYNSGAGGNGAINGAFSRRVLGATTSTSRFADNPIGRVLGAMSSRLLAQGIPNPGGGAAGGTFSSTWTKRVTINRLEGSTPTLYGYTVRGENGATCSCQALLGCQEAQQTSPNSEDMSSGDCDTSCNFTFDSESELPTSTQTVNIDVQANDGFDREVNIDFDDGTDQAVGGPYPARVNYTFNNAGVYDVNLTCRNNGNNEKTCTRRVNVYCDGTDPENLPTATPTPPLAWSKWKDSTLYTKTSLANPAPGAAAAYDSSDNGVCVRNTQSVACVSSGQAGVVTTKGSATYGTRLSDREWLRADSSYTMNTIMNPDTFIEYARARKEIGTIESVTPETVRMNALNLYTGNLTITSNAIPDTMVEGQRVVIIIDGGLTINMPANEGRTFNPDNKPIAFIVTGEVEIASDTEEINGIFISRTVDYAYDSLPNTTTPLKINGNLTTTVNSPSCATKRQRDDNELQPSCFITLDVANQVLPLIDLLSTRTYEWTELVP